MRLFEDLPLIDDDSTSDVRLEALLTKLTLHIRHRLDRTSEGRLLDSDTNITALWLVRTFKMILEKYHGFTAEEVAGNNVLVVKNQAVLEDFQYIMNENGVTEMCLDLISAGIEHELMMEALSLLIMLLVQEHGSLHVQETVHVYLAGNESSFFFETVKDLIESLILAAKKELELDEDFLHAKLQKEIIVLKLLSLMCEGDYKPNKNLLREQEGNTRPVNILEALANYVEPLSRLENHHTTRAVLRVNHTILKLMQGACRGNQEFFVIQTELMSSLNRIIRSSRVHSSEKWNKDSEKEKESIIDIFKTAIDGHGRHSVVLERVATTVELNVLNVLILPSDVDLNGELADVPDQISQLQAKYLVFLQTLYANASADKAIELPQLAKEIIEEEVTAVEVLFQGQLFRNFFHIPAIARGLSEASKRQLKENLETKSQEVKLRDFMRRCHGLWREATHQNWLQRYSLDVIVYVKSWLAWAMFGNALIMNCLLIAYYKTTPDEHTNQNVTSDSLGHLYVASVASSVQSFELTGVELNDTDLGHRMLNAGGGALVNAYPDKLTMDSDVDNIINVLNYVQAVLAAFNLAIIIISNMPIKFQILFAETQQSFDSIYYSYFISLVKVIMEPINLWYSVYFLFTILGITVHNLFLTVLLLDFVLLDTTTRDVLRAVYSPAKQLIATLAVIMISIVVFAAVVFYLYRQDVVELMCDSLWETIKIAISYGVRGEHGVAGMMTNTTGPRFMLDISFYFVVVAILRNIFFGIIIDTFAKLRDDFMEKEANLNNSCTICGADRAEFERLSSLGTKGFNSHRQKVHNVEHYLYFSICIWSQNKEEDNAIEMYVRKCIEEGDISWLPLNVFTADGNEDAEAMSGSQDISEGNFGVSFTKRNKRALMEQSQSWERDVVNKQEAGSGSGSGAVSTSGSGRNSLQAVGEPVVGDPLNASPSLPEALGGLQVANTHKS